MKETYLYNYSSPIGLMEVIFEERYLKNITYITSKIHDNTTTKEIFPILESLDLYFLGKLKIFNTSIIKLEGTTFQKNVWSKLLDIPYGELVSYKYISTKIGNPKGSRAVGNANRNNKIPIIVPCHRVIGANKKLTGYAGGLDKKEWLINHENRYKETLN